MSRVTESLEIYHKMVETEVERHLLIAVSKLLFHPLLITLQWRLSEQKHSEQ